MSHVPTYAGRPEDLEDLLCFWDFQERTGTPRVARGPYRYALDEQGGPIARVDGGVWGAHAVRVEPGQWFNLPREDCPALDLHGVDAQVSVVAWVRWASDQRCQAVAGMWNETRKKRQYALFLNLTKRYDSVRNVHGHVSAVGGPTPGHPYCVSYATGATELPFDQWRCVAMTYDGGASRVYLDGVLDQREAYNPYPYPDGLFDGGSDGADFTVGAVDAAGSVRNFFGGTLGGLAVYQRALSEAELATIGTPVS